MQPGLNRPPWPEADAPELERTRPAAPAPAPEKTRIVIVGGGAAGLELATRLGARMDARRCDVVLVDRNRTHIWKPLLHEVATGSLDANLDEVGYRVHSLRWGYRFVHGALEMIDREARELAIAPLFDEAGRKIADGRRIGYDYLVLAIGSEANDFGTPGIREHCMLLDSHADADRFRNHFLMHCTRVSRAMSANPPREQIVRIAIVGGGATGVELAAELHNAAAGLGSYGLDGFDERRLEVTLIEAAPRILPALREKLAAAAAAELEQLGVQILSSTRITAADAEGFSTAAGEHIGADIMVWVAGVKGPEALGQIDALEISPSRQLAVRPSLQTTLDDRIFAIGDCCRCVLPGADAPVPPRAQAAHQMAAVVADNLERLIRGRPLRPFVYHDHGSLVSLSRYSTVGNLMGRLVGEQLAVEGRIARVIYKSLYAMHLLAIHGRLKGLALIAVGAANRILRPRLKLH